MTINKNGIIYSNKYDYFLFVALAVHHAVNYQYIRIIRNRMMSYLLMDKKGFEQTDIVGCA